MSIPLARGVGRSKNDGPDDMDMPSSSSSALSCPWAWRPTRDEVAAGGSKCGVIRPSSGADSASAAPRRGEMGGGGGRDCKTVGSTGPVAAL